MLILSLQCPSVTYAQKGRRVLAEAGIKSRIIRRSHLGCSYGLECSARDPAAVSALLEKAGVPCTVRDAAT